MEVSKKRRTDTDISSNKRRKIYKNISEEHSVPRVNKPIINKENKKIKTKDCLICMSQINENEIINIHQGHFNMCRECLIEQGKVLLRNRDLLPWRCSICQEEISLSILKDTMTDADYNKLITRQTEIVVGNTVSCRDCDVSYSLPNDYNKNYIECCICNSTITIDEKEKVKEEDINNLLSLAGQENWAQCPGCHELIEKIDGCNSMTHHETDGRITHFCYQCNEVLDDRDIDSLGRPHFPNGSFNDCTNTIRDIENILEDFSVNSDEIDDSIDYQDFNWDNDNQENDNYEISHCCTECNYFTNS